MSNFALPRFITKNTSSPAFQKCLMFGYVFMIAVLAFLGMYLLKDPRRLAITGWAGLISLGFVGIWRWSWVGLHLVRSWIYQGIVFPRWRHRANAIPLADLPPVCLLVPTYKEKPWITERVFRSIALEARSLSQPITVATVSSGPEEDEAIVAALRLGDPTLASVRVFHAIDPGDGKRKALADGLRAIAQLDLPANTVIGLMDGDSEFTPGTLRQTLPFFHLFPNVGALTTDESPYVVGSYFFSEWFHLRFAQRHYMMSSISLSKKVLCLTGRFSLYRSEPALHPDFAAQLENDTLDDWLWGRFKFLSGDDKTTWYWMLRHTQYDLLYIPDVLVYSIESISGSLLNRVYQNMRRWFGNMLRNGNRALALGPKRLGGFVYLCLIDQRLSMWTSLVSPCLLLIAILKFNWIAVGLLVSWLVLSRSLTLILIFWGRESPLKPIHLPILLFTQWSSAFIKIWTLMNLPKQRWFNRGDRKLSSEGKAWIQWIRGVTSSWMLWLQGFSFGLLLFALLGWVDPIQDTIGFFRSASLKEIPSLTYVEVANYGVIPNDGKDDALALQKLIDQLPAKELVKVKLPIGELDLFSALKLYRNHTILEGQGTGRTILKVHSSGNSTGISNVGLLIQPSDYFGDSTTLLSANKTKKSSQLKAPIAGIEVRDITFTSDRLVKDQTTGIMIKDVENVSLKNLEFDSSFQDAILLDKEKGVHLEYITMNGSAIKNKSSIISQN